MSHLKTTTQKTPLTGQVDRGASSATVATSVALATSVAVASSGTDAFKKHLSRGKLDREASRTVATSVALASSLALASSGMDA